MLSVAQLQAGEQSEQTDRQKRSSHTPEEGVCSRDLPDSYGDPKSEQSTLVMVRRKPE